MKLESSMVDKRRIFSKIGYAKRDVVCITHLPLGTDSGGSYR
uniref:Uncharacterized protein n=1 Tax=Triticum urartu TaxID=4572 RepID=A0A8R7QM94_TRIUA